MFLEQNELGSTMYDYQIEEITEGDDSIVLEAINAAIIEVKGYLSNNNKKEWLDGRLQYDVPAVFNATGTDRNALLLAHTKTIAKWYIVELCNADIIYEKAKERYDRATEWLTKLSKGVVNLPDLPQLNLDETQPDRQPISYGSRTKFNHDIE